MMKIIYCIHGLKNSGGMERVISEKANYLSKCLDYDVTIITLNQTDITFFKLHESIKVIPFNVNDLKSLIQYVNQEKPRIFISTGGKEIGILPFLSCDIVKIVEIHFCFYFSILREIAANRGFFYRMYGALKLLRYIFFLNFSDIVISLTSKDCLKWQRVLPFSKAKVIGNPVPFLSDTQFSQPTVALDNVVRFVAVGRLDYQKGFNDLIQICNLFKERYRSGSWTLDIYGDGELKELFENQIADLNLQKNVRILNSVKDLTPIYRNATALLMTSYYEGMPMVMLEALSFGLPCIAFDCDSGPAELIEDGKNGFLIAKRNQHDFVSKMIGVALMDAFVLGNMRCEALRVIDAYKIDKIMFGWDTLFRGKL